MDNDVLQMAEVLTEIGRCRGTIFASNNWRLQEQYVTSLACLPSFYTSDQIHQMILSVMFIRLRAVVSGGGRFYIEVHALLLWEHSFNQLVNNNLYSTLCRFLLRGSV